MASARFSVGPLAPPTLLLLLLLLLVAAKEEPGVADPFEVEFDELAPAWCCAMNPFRHSSPSAPSSIGDIGRFGPLNPAPAAVGAVDVDFVQVSFGGRLLLAEEEGEALLLFPLELDGPAMLLVVLLASEAAVPEKTRWRCREPRPSAERDERLQSGAAVEVDVEAVGCLVVAGGAVEEAVGGLAGG